jgi:D-Tyr-tRNAtyr deacylase
MKAVVQRVKDVSVNVDGVVSGSIDRGLLYLGVAKGDTPADAEKLAPEPIMSQI